MEATNSKLNTLEATLNKVLDYIATQPKPKDSTDEIQQPNSNESISQKMEYILKANEELLQDK